MPTDSTIRRKRYLVAGRFDERPGYRVQRPKGSHDWLVIYTRRGQGQFEYSGGQLQTQPHQAVLLAPQTPHSYEVAPGAERWELLWSHFVPPVDWLRWLKWPQVAPGVGCVRIETRLAQASIVERLDEVHRLLAGRQVHREALAQNALQAALVWCSEQIATSPRAALDPRVADALDFICRRLNQPLTVAVVARHCHLSPSRLAHLFGQQMQMAPMQFVEQQRIERARQLLETDGSPVAAVARRVGFTDPFYFSRRFKRAVGASPREYRERLAAAAGDGTT